jgi:hypothetical protein
MAPTSEKPAAPIDSTARTFSMSLDINATPEEVWRASPTPASWCDGSCCKPE